MFKSANCNSLLPSAFHFLVLLSVVAIQINCSLFCLYNGYFVSFLGCPTFEPLLYLENSLICESRGRGEEKQRQKYLFPVSLSSILNLVLVTCKEMDHRQCMVAVGGERAYGVVFLGAAVHQNSNDVQLSEPE